MRCHLGDWWSSVSIFGSFLWILIEFFSQKKKYLILSRGEMQWCAGIWESSDQVFHFFEEKNCEYFLNILFKRVYNIVKWTAVVRWHLGEWWISREIPIYALCPWLHHHPPWHTSKRTDIVKIITSRILARTFDAQPVLQCTLYGWAAAH